MGLLCRTWGFPAGIVQIRTSVSTESSSSSGESRCGGEQMDLGILGWVTDNFRESFLEKVNKTKKKPERLSKRDIGCCRFSAMAYWEKLLQHIVLKSCRLAVVLGRAFRQGTGSTQAVRRVGAAHARAGYARTLAVCALGWHLGDAV